MKVIDFDADGVPIFECAVCGKNVSERDLCQTYDCHGIPYRAVCENCYEKIMVHGKGYDGEYYSEADECLDEFY